MKVDDYERDLSRRWEEMVRQSEEDEDDNIDGSPEDRCDFCGDDILDGCECEFDDDDDCYDDELDDDPFYGFDY